MARDKLPPEAQNDQGQFVQDLIWKKSLLIIYIKRHSVPLLRAHLLNVLLLALMGRQNLPESFRELEGLISQMFPQGICFGRKDEGPSPGGRDLKTLRQSGQQGTLSL